MQGKKYGLGFLVLLAAAITIGLLVYAYQVKTGQNFDEQDGTQPVPITLSGKRECLPRKDTGGAEAKECTLGFRTESGEYYIFDTESAAEVPDFMKEEVFTAIGTIKPIERLSTTTWNAFDVVGVFSVNEIKMVAGAKPEPEPEPVPVAPAPPTPLPPVQGCFVGGCSREVCGSEPEVVTNCMYKEEYACYQTAVCERQASGVCGWTETPGLVSCLSAVADGDSEVPAVNSSLTVKSWEWITAEYSDGRTVVPKESGRFVLSFDAKGTWFARTDCNGVGGEYVLGANDQLTFSEMMRSTLMYCGDSQEVVFQQLLRDTVVYHITGAGELVLTLKAGGGTVLFR
ncbi:META domain-containing protein [Patescibacteria group bacterium]|nr:META domain-containing protein [Patescibacteria group bacterium]